VEQYGGIKVGQKVRFRATGEDVVVQEIKNHDHLGKVYFVIPVTAKFDEWWSERYGRNFSSHSRLYFAERRELDPI